MRHRSFDRFTEPQLITPTVGAELSTIGRHPDRVGDTNDVKMGAVVNEKPGGQGEPRG